MAPLPRTSAGAASASSTMSLLPLVWVGVLILVARSVAADPSGTANLTDPSKQQEEEVPPYYKAVGITLALTSGFFIGSSFIFKKKGLIDTNTLHGEVGAGHAYLKSGLWWTGMILMALGEFANFGAYAFTPAILVTPLGALSVVISAILASVFLKEKLNLSGKVGCAQCLIGATIIVLHAPATNATETIPEFFSYVLAPGFIVYSIIVAAVVFYLIYGLAPKYGDKNPIIYISICSIVGSFLVLSTQGFGSSIVYSARHWHTDNQFKQWAMYPLFGFIVFTVCVQIHFLNKALNLFSTAIVTPVYYVFFTTTTLISSAVLFRGFAVDSAVAGVSLVMGFLVIVGGVVLLFQYSLKVTKLAKISKAAATAGGNNPSHSHRVSIGSAESADENVEDDFTDDGGDEKNSFDVDVPKDDGLGSGYLAQDGAVPTKALSTDRLDEYIPPTARRRRPSKQPGAEGQHQHQPRAAPQAQNEAPSRNRGVKAIMERVSNGTTSAEQMFKSFSEKMKPKDGSQQNSSVAKPTQPSQPHPQPQSQPQRLNQEARAFAPETQTAPSRSSAAQKPEPHQFTTAPSFSSSTTSASSRTSVGSTSAARHHATPPPRATLISASPTAAAAVHQARQPPPLLPPPPPSPSSATNAAASALAPSASAPAAASATLHPLQLPPPPPQAGQSLQHHHHHPQWRAGQQPHFESDSAKTVVAAGAASSASGGVGGGGGDGDRAGDASDRPAEAAGGGGSGAGGGDTLPGSRTNLLTAAPPGDDDDDEDDIVAVGTKRKAVGGGW